VARAWNDVLLDAIRNDRPVPTVHARNLFHVSAAMYDAWAAYDESARGYFVDAGAATVDVNTVGATPAVIDARRVDTISTAAWVVLTERYKNSAETTLESFDNVLAEYCLDRPQRRAREGTAQALGLRIGHAVLAQTIDDGSLEAKGYEADPWDMANPALAVDRVGTSMADPNRWQPLEFPSPPDAEDPNERIVQAFTTPHWGSVVSFAMDDLPDPMPIDPGTPPLLGDLDDADFKEAVLDVIEFSSVLDANNGVLLDASPNQRGANTLGADDGIGYAVNPIAGNPYEPNIVPLGDYGRVLAEFWADGPQSETPPGHWNTLANEVSDHPELEHRSAETGEPVDRLEWDVKLYFALNGALHDAAVAAWGSKAVYDYVRPVSMIRYLGGNGQSSDPLGESYDPEGLPLQSGLVEVITEESSAAGGHHEALADHIGEIAVRSWTAPGDEPVQWILATQWLPYQESTFVTPSFPGYVSGHSTFSRAAAVVMTRYTGSEFFPGGLGGFTIEPGWLKFDEGPTQPITLQWATYYDAADEAGLSRLYGGIHVAVDDYGGRIMGATCGELAYDKALDYFDPA